MSKVYERIILDKIQASYKELQLENKNQYGFKKGRSTDDAILHLIKSIRITQKKYVTALFVDIQGVFDNLWWPSIKMRLAEANCSSNMMKIVTSYFQKRKITITSKQRKLSCWMQRRCPQGCIIGPLAWNWCMDTLLDEFDSITEDVEAIAYADDVAILIKANSRSSLEDLAKIAINILIEWCKSHKLMISAIKTNAMLVKGKLDKNKNPIIKINNNRIKFTQQIKYLGVWLDDKLSFTPHVKYIREKLININMAIRRIA